jgi:hypothetical protein
MAGDGASPPQEVAQLLHEVATEVTPPLKILCLLYVAK